MTPNPATLKLPIGLQDFPTLIERGYQYVDKTEQIYGLVNKGEVYFLSRPRRFGKSLLISTLQALFEGRRELFKGLWIEQSGYDWPVYPVLRLDLSRPPTGDVDALSAFIIEDQLLPMAARYGLVLAPSKNAAVMFDRLIRVVGEQIGPLVVLVDEYDKPLLNVIESAEQVGTVKAFLRDFYQILKAQGQYLRFVFLTGVSKFSQVSVFSGLNNLIDLSMETEFSGLLGYTQSELEQYFAPWLTRLAAREGVTGEALLEKVKYWYNGYRFSEEATAVYNPFSTLLLFRTQRFQPHWFETGPPTFLTALLAKQPRLISSLEGYRFKASRLSGVTETNLDPVSLLLQTGYLTIQSYDSHLQEYRLNYPNREVKEAFADHLLLTMLGPARELSEQEKLQALVSALAEKDYGRWVDEFNGFLTALPYDLQEKTETYYKSLFYLLHLVAGQMIYAEVHTHQGRADVMIETDTQVWVIEFKVDQSAQMAIDQIKGKDYPARYKREGGREVTLIGVNVNSEKRQVDGWLVETV